MLNTKPLIISTLVLLTWVAGIHADDKNATPSLTIRGQATLYKPADELQMNVGVVTQGETAEKALTENSAAMTRVIQSIAEAGLQDGEYKTGRFSIRPIYSQRPKSPPPDWQTKIVSYEVTNTIGIKTEQIKRTGEIIDSAIRAGANNVDSIRFGLKDPRMYRAEVIGAATQNAKADAQTLGQAADVKLVRILKLSLDDAQSYEPVRKDRFFAQAMSTNSAPMEPGDVQISGSVVIAYEID